jgi:hypothetical protein
MRYQIYFSIAENNADQLKKSENRGETSRIRSLLSIQWFIIMSGAIGISAIFLPFAYTVSPLSAALDTEYGFWRLGCPALLPALITLASLRWLISDTLSPPERVICYLAGGACTAMVCVTLYSFIQDSGWPKAITEWLTIIFPIMTLGFGIFALLRIRHKLMLKPYLAIMSMQFVYLANSLLCLCAFFREWDLGAYFVLVTVLAYLIQIILVTGAFKVMIINQ